MERNAYQPPESDLIGEDTKSSYHFYVVSKKKLSILFILTLGLYAIYWFYVNWRNQRDYNGASVIPFLRAIFYIFFTHSLFEIIEKAAKVKDQSYNWASQSQATFYILLAIAGNVADRMSTKDLGSPYTDIAALLILPFMLMVLRNAQGAINFSQDDPEGSINSTMTIYNYLWIALGVLIWLILILGIFIILGLVAI